MATGLTLTTAGAAEIEAAYQAGEVVHITSVLIGDGGGVTVPTDPDDLAAVTALFGQFGRETFDSDSSNEGVISGQIVINCRVKRSERRGWSVLRVRSLLTACTRRRTSRRNLIPSSKRSF